MLVAFNKPYGVLTQFTDKAVPPRPTLAGYAELSRLDPVAS